MTMKKIKNKPLTKGKGLRKTTPKPLTRGTGLKNMYYAYYNDQTVLGLPKIVNNQIQSVKFYFDNKSDIKKVINYHVKTKWWLKDIKENTVIKNDK